MFAWPIVRLSDVAEHVGHFGLIYVHVVGGVVMLVVGAAALYVGWTRRAFRWHRALGYTYLVVGGAGAVLGIVLALANIHSDPVAPLAFDSDAVSSFGLALATQGVAWLVTAGMAFRAALNRRFEAHRAWMIRSYVVAWAFVLGIFVEWVPVLDRDAAPRWLALIVSLVACEVALGWRETSPRSRPVSPTGRPLPAVPTNRPDGVPRAIARALPP